MGNLEHSCEEGRIAEGPQDQGKVCSNRAGSDVGRQAEQVQRNMVVIAKTLPKLLETDVLTVVHRALSWVVSENTHGDNSFFSISEPCGTCRHY